MYIDTEKIVTMTAANQNFSAVARQTERDGMYVGALRLLTLMLNVFTVEGPSSYT